MEKVISDKTHLKKIDDAEKKKLLVDLLERLIKYFEKNNITYYVAYGTLLGTIRHQGFIPWDDDIDLLVPRADFIKLIHIIEKDKEILCNDNMEIVPYNQIANSYHQRFKIADTRTVMEEYGADRSAVFIDVFPLDGIKNKGQKEKCEKRIKKISRLLVLCHSKIIVNKGLKGLMERLLLVAHKMMGIKRMEKCYEKKLIKETRLLRGG